MTRNNIIAIAVVLVVIIGGIVWFMQSGAPATPTATASDIATTVPDDTTSSTPPAQILMVGTDASGNTYLESGTGMSLYTYASDTANSGTSACTGDCATNWPPYTVASAADLVPSPTASGTLGTITRDDGTLQVTYNGMPLYLYVQDVNTGDTNGTSVSGWSLAKP